MKDIIICEREHCSDCGETVNGNPYEYLIFKSSYQEETDQWKQELRSRVRCKTCQVFHVLKTGEAWKERREW